MSHSYTNLMLHIIFSTKYRQPLLGDRIIRSEMHAYIGGTCNRLNCQSIIVNGVEDHIHILCRQSRTITVADLLEEIKRESSKWIKTKRNNLATFSWQVGYAAFSIGRSEVERVRKYIENQERHHTEENFKDELRKILKAHNIEYDDRYIWN